MSFGYMGRVCFVDLTRGEVRSENVDDKVYRDFLGGVGLAAKILSERQRANADALGPENIIGFATGLLTGCGVPSAVRCTVAAKSPLTGSWGDSSVGGYLGSEIKACGYDAIFFQGISSDPVYLLIDSDRAELRDASHLWGKDTFETTEILHREVGDPGFKIACIGPAGEALSWISAIIIDKERVAARSGLGAVMGAKQLKAVAVKGDRKTEVAHPKKMNALIRDFTKHLNKSTHPLIEAIRRRGTCFTLGPGVLGGDAPIKNWNFFGAEAMPTYDKLSGENIVKYRVRKAGCPGCPLRCKSVVKIDQGAYSVEETATPEYETLVAFGTLCLNDDLESVIKANNICNRYGIDTISAGETIAWAMECYERGIITKNDTGGVELSWGNAAAIVAILEKMVKREGFGGILADGVRRAAEQIGKGAEEYAMHIHGQELPYHDPRHRPCRGTAYIADPTPSRHVQYTAMLIKEAGGTLGNYPELEVPEVEANDYRGKGPMYATAVKYFEAFVASGFCSFSAWAGPVPIVEFIAAATGWDTTAGELLVTGERIQTLRHAFNFREGLLPGDFFLPRRLSEPIPAGPHKGITHDFDTLTTVYYKAMNWDTETGEPSKQRVEELGLGEILRNGFKEG
jgi:aldehyde:ferredoxin oxidoreductase